MAGLTSEDGLCARVVAKLALPRVVARSAEPRPGFSALRERNFRIFLTGQTISLAGFWMQSVAQSWLVLELSSSPTALGLVNALHTLPVLLFSLYAGSLADRFDKRKVMLILQVALALLTLFMAVLASSGSIRLWHIYLLVLALGFLNTIDVTFRQAILSELAGKDSLANAISMNTMVFNLARIVGPSIAGVVISAVGTIPCFYINAASYLAVAIALLALDKSKMQTTVLSSDAPRQSPTQATLEGLRYIWGRAELIRPLVLMAVLSAFVINFNTIIPIFSRQDLRLDARGLGFLMASLGAGSFCSALLLAAMGRKKPSLTWMYSGALALPLLLLIAGLQSVFPLSCLLFFGIGFSTIAFSNSCNAFLQLKAEDRFRGRVISAFYLVFGGVTPIGSLISGAVTQKWGVRPYMVAAGLIGVCASGLAVAGYLKKEKSRLLIDLGPR